jgi:hypothetical protein
LKCEQQGTDRWDRFAGVLGFWAAICTNILDFRMSGRAEYQSFSAWIWLPIWTDGAAVI